MVYIDEIESINFIDKHGNIIPRNNSKITMLYEYNGSLLTKKEYDLRISLGDKYDKLVKFEEHQRKGK